MQGCQLAGTTHVLVGSAAGPGSACHLVYAMVMFVVVGTPLPPAPVTVVVVCVMMSHSRLPSKYRVCLVHPLTVKVPAAPAELSSIARSKPHLVKVAPAPVGGLGRPLGTCFGHADCTNSAVAVPWYWYRDCPEDG